MKFKKYYVMISIIILSVIVLLQFNNFYDKAYSNYIFDLKNEVEKNNYNNVIYEYILEAVKLKMPEKAKNVVVIFDEDFRQYSDGLTLEFGYTVTDMYPYHVLSVNYSDEVDDDMMKYFSNQKTDTIIFLGHHMDFSNTLFENEVNILNMSSNEELTLIDSFNSDINSLSNIFIENKHQDLSKKLYDITKKLAEIYSNQDAINELLGGDIND